MFMFLFPIVSMYACPECGGDFLRDGENATFRLTGFDPFLGINYTGTLVITRGGDVYAFQWAFDDGVVNLGTGVRQDDHLSVVFVDPTTEGGTPGVQSYEIISRKRIRGPWTYLGASLVGEESGRRVD
ncbi:MAG: hypothetical protein LW832_00275 [Parachlamydia sp.]|nr:hypothetical protein [Parachlamydia sp.]